VVDGDEVVCSRVLYFFISSERLDVEEDGVVSESSPPYFLSKNDFVEGVVVDGSAYFFIISERLGVCQG
jgi:hypothetical protein